MRQSATPVRLGSRRQKYNAKPETVDGIRYASRHEARRAGELALLVRAGEVRNLERQVKFELRIADTLVCTYIADFVYDDPSGHVVEDAKGVRTPEYRIKRRLMKAIFGIDIREV